MYNILCTNNNGGCEIDVGGGGWVASAGRVTLAYQFMYCMLTLSVD